MAKYNMSEQAANKVFSKVLGNMDIVGAIETIMGSNKEMENTNMASKNELLYDAYDKIFKNLKDESKKINKALETEFDTQFQRGDIHLNIWGGSHRASIGVRVVPETEIYLESTIDNFEKGASSKSARFLLGEDTKNFSSYCISEATSFIKEQIGLINKATSDVVTMEEAKMEKRVMTADNDLQDIKEQLAELKTELSVVKEGLSQVRNGLAYETTNRLHDKENSLHDKLLELLLSGKYGTYMSTIHRATLNMGQELFDDIVQYIDEIGHKPPIGAIVSVTKKYAKRNNLSTKHIEDFEDL